MKSVNAFIDQLFADKQSETNGRENTIRRAFLPSERYRIDFAEDVHAEAWEQFDTDQDASYFGFWVNKTTFQTLTYAEGDWIHVSCVDAAHYNAEIEHAIRFYGEGFIAKAIDDHGNRTIYRQARKQFLATV